MNQKVRVIASPGTWMEGESVQQLQNVATRPEMLNVVGLPDMQPGKGAPSGAAFMAKIIYGDLVGSDGGCGIGYSVTTLSAKKARVDDLLAKMNGLDALWDGTKIDKWLADRGVAPSPNDLSLGTPGRGNHFIEVQVVVDVFDQSLFDAIGMDKTALHVMVHSGSRSLGESVLRDYAALHGAGGVTADSEAGQHYIKQARHAMAWAVANRQLCAHRVMLALRGESKELLDVCHNSVTEALVDGCQCWLHRKGAAPSDQGPVLIPGSRDDLSYLVSPRVDIDTQKASLWSLAHGAGRRISRSDAAGKLATRYHNRDIRKNRWGGRLLCGEKPLLLEEAAECYKPIDSVIKDLEEFGLIKIVATMRPMVTFKTSEGVETALRQDRKQWQRERSQARAHKRNRC
jgi:release factor H-coupled RctB family protein